jgi:hypothetical protein
MRETETPRVLRPGTFSTLVPMTTEPEVVLVALGLVAARAGARRPIAVAGERRRERHQHRGSPPDGEAPSEVRAAGRE